MRVWRNWQTRWTQDPVGFPCRFNSCHPHQKSRINRIRLFLSKSQTWYIIDARSAAYIISSFGAVYHHASACISLRLDEIQHYVLVICNSFGIDDIQGLRLDFIENIGLQGQFLSLQVFFAFSRKILIVQFIPLSSGL